MRTSVGLAPFTHSPVTTHAAEHNQSDRQQSYAGRFRGQSSVETFRQKSIGLSGRVEAIEEQIFTRICTHGAPVEAGIRNIGKPISRRIRDDGPQQARGVVEFDSRREFRSESRVEGVRERSCLSR